MPASDDRSRKPLSEKKRAANRANAQKSTGPRTAEGKARAVMNAVIHADTLRHVMTHDENTNRFVMFAKLVRADLRPANFVQSMLVERAIDLMWKLRRAQSAQQGYMLDDMSESLEFISAEREKGRGEGAGYAALLDGSRILLESIREPAGKQGAYLRLDLYADRLQRALMSVLLRLRQEQDRTGMGKPPEDDQFTLKALRRAAKLAGVLNRRDNAESLSEPTAGAAGGTPETATTDEAAKRCGGIGTAGGDAPEKSNLQNEPTESPRSAELQGTESSMN